MRVVSARLTDQIPQKMKSFSWCEITKKKRQMNGVGESCGNAEYLFQRSQDPLMTIHLKTIQRQRPIKYGLNFILILSKNIDETHSELFLQSLLKTHSTESTLITNRKKSLFSDKLWMIERMEKKLKGEVKNRTSIWVKKYQFLVAATKLSSSLWKLKTY